MAKKRTPVTAKMSNFYMVYYPSRRSYFRYATPQNSEVIAYRDPERAIAEAVQWTDNPKYEPGPFVILKYIPVAVVEPEYHQRRISEKTATA